MAPRREDLGSWLEGTPGGSPVAPTSAGREVVLRTAGLGRRVAALGLDWLAGLAVAALIGPTDPQALNPLLGADPMLTLAVFAGSSAVLVGLTGHTIGHRVAGLRVVRLSPVGRHSDPPGLLAGAVRTGLLCLVLPAVVWDRSGRGLHDVAARTSIVRR